MKHSARRSTKAFTLIELSIVLVGIGLLVGGVLVGKDLIEAAELRQATSDIQQIKTSMHTFRLKYDCLPGDCKRATQFGFGPNGSGDGSYDTYIGGSPTNYQSYQNEGRMLFWEHLQKSGIWDLGVTTPGVYGGTYEKGKNIPDWAWLRTKNLNGTGRNQQADIYLRNGNPCAWPTWGCSDLDAGIIANRLNDNTIVIGGMGRDLAGDPLRILHASPLSSDFAALIDQKIDDGKPMTGNVFGKYVAGQYWNTNEHGSCGSGSANTSQSYISGYTCMLKIRP